MSPDSGFRDPAGFRTRDSECGKSLAAGAAGRSGLLDRRALYIAITAIHAAIARLWLQQSAATFAVIEILARIRWHRLAGFMTASRASDCRFQNDCEVRHMSGQPKAKHIPTEDQQPEPRSSRAEVAGVAKSASRRLQQVRSGQSPETTCCEPQQTVQCLQAMPFQSPTSRKAMAWRSTKPFQTPPQCLPT